MVYPNFIHIHLSIHLHWRQVDNFVLPVSISVLCSCGPASWSQSVLRLIITLSHMTSKPSTVSLHSQPLCYTILYYLVYNLGYIRNYFWSHHEISRFTIISDFGAGLLSDQWYSPHIRANTPSIWKIPKLQILFPFPFILSFIYSLSICNSLWKSEYSWKNKTSARQLSTTMFSPFDFWRTMALNTGRQNSWKVSAGFIYCSFMNNTMGKLLIRVVRFKLYGVWRVDVWACEWALEKVNSWPHLDWAERIFPSHFY